MKTYKPTIIKHVKVCGRPDTYCGHPVEAGEIFNFGNGEIAFMHLHTDHVTYDGTTCLMHGQTGIHGNAKVLLTRSFDGGLTWSEKDQSVVFDQGAPIEEQEAILSRRITEEESAPATENTIFHFGKSFCGPYLSDGKRREIMPYAVRSEDKGYTWSEKVSIPDNVGFTFLQASSTIIRQGNRWLKPFEVSISPEADNCTYSTGPVVLYHAALYSSENNGVTWQFVSEMARDPYNESSFGYCQTLDLGNGHLLTTLNCWRGRYENTRWISVCHSYDNGLNWTEPKRIQSYGISGYPLLLKDGRIVIIYVKRYPASVRGVYAMVSEDHGESWSEEFALRTDASSADIGYPVAIQTDNGNIFTGYYYTSESNQEAPAARYIAGTIFTI